MRLPRFPFKTPYGHFSDDGKSFIITKPDAPRPWRNVISAGEYGVSVSQTGSGFSWREGSPWNRTTRGGGDALLDDEGRHIYIRDERTGEFWSAGWQPTQPAFDHYQCVHGVGCTIITSQFKGIQAQWLVFVPQGETLEIWRLRIRNLSKKPRQLTLWTYLEWGRGVAGEDGGPGGFFTRPSLEGNGRVVVARRFGPPPQDGVRSRAEEGFAWHAVSAPVRDWCGAREAFLGAYGSRRSPAALRRGRYDNKVSGDGGRPAAGLCVPVPLKAGQEKSLLLSIGVAGSETRALAKARQFQDFSQVDNAWNNTEMFWDKYLSSFTVETPDPSFDLLANTWLKYQTLSGISRGGLEESPAFLPLDAERVRERILAAAAGVSRGRLSDDAEGALWLPSVVLSYLRETGQWNLLSARAAGVDGQRRGAASVYDAAGRALEEAWKRFAAPWLSAAGGSLPGANAWTAQFLCGLLTDWAAMVESAAGRGELPAAEKRRAVKFLSSGRKLKAALNRRAWDGEWYAGGIDGKGAVFGTRRGREGRVYLDSQVWSVLGGVADVPARRKTLAKSIERHLESPHGPLFLAPPHEDSAAGYPPGARENGGVQTRAAAWALQMECALGRPRRAWELYKKLSPVLRGSSNPALYGAEPFVVPDHVDGPASVSPGRAEGAWSANSAAWLYKALTEGILGIQPDWDGLRIRPCLPPEWKTARAARVFRGGTYRIQFRRDPKLKPGAQKIVFNGRPLAGEILPALSNRTHDVLVFVGPAGKE
jgi:cellobiose phosphorylase